MYFITIVERFFCRGNIIMLGNGWPLHAATNATLQRTQAFNLLRVAACYK
jgi:hypothetical protein